MMLKDPFLNEPFEPDLMWFVGVFDVYDREETKGVELEIYDPNDRADRSVLITKYCLNQPYLSFRHKLVLIENLEAVLKDSSFDFQAVFEIDECETNSWPREEWYSLENPRCFFQDVFRLAQEIWKEDLLMATNEDRSTW
ncbi:MULTISPECIES: hypothetical protein [Pseudomonas]|uniref:hypothetical protein n=1 Tax=Pseudomonas TaxID=286 RepID=UPI0006FD34CD|nr:MULTISPECIES: hypothetical protein [Pseudomonas]KQT67187.1 hypothetical protein ASG55_04635 [Pseudomonas sp. Leaf434]WLG64057.1 hypothetical protein PSH90_08065 [Pseudomonas sp. FP1762]